MRLFFFKKCFILLALYGAPVALVLFLILTFAISLLVTPFIAVEIFHHNRANFKDLNGIKCREVAQTKTGALYECHWDAYFQTIRFDFTLKTDHGEMNEISNLKTTVLYNWVTIVCDIFLRITFSLFFWIGWRFVFKRLRAV